MKILNYTVYSTEDIQKILTVIKAKERKKGILSRPVSRLVIVYWQGRARISDMNVRPDCPEAPEWGAHVLRIKRPHQLSVSALELLAMQVDQPFLPASVVREVSKALRNLLSDAWRTQGLKSPPPVRVMPAPDLVDSTVERKRRVGVKKVRKAVKAVISNCGLRMGPSALQLKDKIDRLEAIQDLLSPNETALLGALKTQQAAMQEIAEISKNLRDEYKTP